MCKSSREAHILETSFRISKRMDEFISSVISLGCSDGSGFVIANRINSVIALNKSILGMKNFCLFVCFLWISGPVGKF